MILLHSKNNFWKFLHRIDRCIAQILIWFIANARPLFGPSQVCPFPIGCTEFAIQQLQSCWFGLAMLRITFRLLQCNPIGLRLLKS